MDIENQQTLEIKGWLEGRRDHGGIVFLDIRYSMQSVQVVCDCMRLSSDDADAVKHLPIGSGIVIKVEKATGAQAGEYHAIQLVADYPYSLTQEPPSRIHTSADEHQVGVDTFLANRHIYIRSSRVREAMIARHKLLRFLHNWFERNSYIEINAPILTKLPLYDDKSAIELELHNQRLFLTQCVGYYLESAVQAFERVYNIGPSFRAEDSRSNRHLVEYWHVKLEACWLDRKKIMQHVEHLVRDIVDFARVELLELSGVLGTKIVPAIDMPFHQMTYKDAMSMISRHQEFKLGDHIGKNEERWLHISKPTWIIGNPRLSEPFPYRIDPDDGELTLTADLVLPDGYGELLGIAEKIYDPVELETRMHEKGRVVDSEFHWLVELRKSGMVPHSGMGMGMGLERLLRWLVQGGHVRDFSAFPRLYGRQYSP